MPRHVLRASVADVRTVASLLRPIAFSQLAHVVASDCGLEFITEKSRSVEAHAYLSSTLFESYSFHLPTKPTTRQGDESSSTRNGTQASEDTLSYPSEDPRIPKRRRLLEDEGGELGATSQQDPDEEDDEEDSAQVEFEINLHNLLECLNIFGGAPSSSKHPGGHGAAAGGSGFGGGGKEKERYGGGGGGGGFRAGSTAPGGKDMVRVERDRNSTAMVLSYQGEGEPLTLLLTESAVETRCELATFVPGGISALSFDHYRMVGQAIIASDWLHDAFLGIDASCRNVSVRFSPSYTTSTSEARVKGSAAGGGGESSVSIAQSSGSTTIEAAAAARDRAQERGQRGRTVAPSSSAGSAVKDESAKGKTRSVQMFKITADGDFGSAEFEFPNDRGVMEKFVARYDVENRYRFEHFSLAQRALGSSVKTSVRVDDVGLLSFQFLMPLGEGLKAQPAGAGAMNRSFVELVWIPLESEEGDST